nr:uncharacterized protein LOC129282844 [Lytechinus pictus]
MTQLPTLCMVNYDQEEPPGFRYRLPPELGRRRRGNPDSSPRHAFSLPNSPRCARVRSAYGRGHSTAFPAGHRQSLLTSKDDSYTTQTKNSSNLPNTLRERRRSQSQDALPLISREAFNSRTPNNSMVDPLSRESRMVKVNPSYTQLPPLKTMGETSLTANAELLDGPIWNEYLQAWVSRSQAGVECETEVLIQLSFTTIAEATPDWSHSDSLLFCASELYTCCTIQYNEWPLEPVLRPVAKHADRRVVPIQLTFAGAFHSDRDI